MLQPGGYKIMIFPQFHQKTQSLSSFKQFAVIDSGVHQGYKVLTLFS